MLWLQNLRLATKFIVIALLFLAPVALLGYLFVQQSLKDIHFADRERTGTLYLLDAWPLFEDAIAGIAPSARQVNDLATRGEDYDRSMDTGAARATFLEASSRARVQAGQDFIQKISDGSYLTLDPDLDSYYVMDATTIKMPEVAAAGQAAMEAAREMRSRSDPLQQEKATGPAFAVGRLLRSARALQGSYDSAANGNPDATVRASLEAPMKAVLAAADKLADGAQALSRLPSTSTPETSALSALEDDQAVLQADLDVLWRASRLELDGLLARRVEGCWHKLLTSLALVAALLVAVVGLMAAVSRSVTDRLAHVASAMDEMRSGNLEHVVPHLEGRDEIGAIARTLEVFRERLISLRAFEGELIAKEANKAAESRFREILDASPIGIVIATKQALPLYCNAGFADILGSSKQKILGRDLGPIWSDGVGLMDRLQRDEKVRDLEMTLTRDDGGAATCLLSGETIEYEGEPAALRWVYDITERKKTEAEMRTAQARLIQSEKLASLGQLTAGIAHEIKNPLNFVNNFSDLSRDLVAELRETLAPADLESSTRDEVELLTQMISDNLEKVVQHGKRADSIVRNMLLHSRGGSGERRSVDINATVREAVNLAYHGARAEKPSFNVTLKSDFDPAAGDLEIYPQEFTRVLVNLVSNGFYAVAKRKAGSGDPTYDPTLTTTTKVVADRLEISILDNGVGIPDEIKAKMFTPFFTTKPAGEGTGLGLSLSHDIVVKQHGGTIDLHSRAGEYTEFVVTLPLSGSLALRRAS